MNTSEPSCDAAKTHQLAEILKSKNQKQLKDLLKVSDNIASSVKIYYDAFELKHKDTVKDTVKHTHTHTHKDTDSTTTDNNTYKPAVFTFDGPAFKGINPSSCDTNTIHYMQTHLRIIDPLYGALRPLDLIQPYRLEMATKAILKDLIDDNNTNTNTNTNTKQDTFKFKSLAHWWKDTITTNILTDMQHSDCKVLINLASDEYSSAIDIEQLKQHHCRFVKIAFQQEGKVIAVHAKRARGLMVRYISDNQLHHVQGIQEFNLEGYCFCQDKSQEDTIVFDRSKNWKDYKGDDDGEGDGDDAGESSKAAALGQKRKGKAESGKAASSKKAK